MYILYWYYIWQVLEGDLIVGEDLRGGASFPLQYEGYTLATPFATFVTTKLLFMLCFWNVLFGRKHAQPTIWVRGLGGCIFTGSTSTIWNSAREVSSFSINSPSHVCVPADSQLLILHCWYSNVTVAQMFSPLTTGRSLSWLLCSFADPCTQPIYLFLASFSSFVSHPFSLFLVSKFLGPQADLKLTS